MKIVSVEEMVLLEKNANISGIPYETMMKNAGTGVAAWVTENLDLKKGVAGLVGSGNNGGDTLIALTQLSQQNVRTFAFLVRHRESDPYLNEYRNTGGTIIDISSTRNLVVLEEVISEKVILLDGMLGTGFRPPLRGALASVMRKVHDLVSRLPNPQIIAVDCPSGVDCDTGEVAIETLKANATLTMAAVKQGLLKYPARSFAGEIHCLEIGIPIENRLKNKSFPDLIDRQTISQLLPVRPDSGHKGTFGTCMIIAGTEPYTGAAFLAGKAAYRAGCGLVNVATLKKVHDVLAGRLIEAVWTILPENGGGYDPIGVDAIGTASSRADALVIGPGWGVNEINALFLERVLAILPRNKPLLIDADGLKLLNRLNLWWEKLPENTILTPHPGEMALLTGFSVSDIEADRWEIARHYAQKWGVILILKGAMTVIALPKGSLLISPIGDSALATAGSGDVLSGLIGGLLAQGLSQEKASVLGVWIHGRAGQSAHGLRGSAAGVTAVDILDQIKMNVQ